MTQNPTGVDFALALLECLTDEEIDEYLASRGLVFERELSTCQAAEPVR
jgi:hypothetical protein